MCAARSPGSAPPGWWWTWRDEVNTVNDHDQEEMLLMETQSNSVSVISVKCLESKGLQHVVDLESSMTHCFGLSAVVEQSVGIGSIAPDPVVKGSFLSPLGEAHLGWGCQ